MKPTTARAYLLTGFLMIWLLPQSASAIIIDNYTAFFEDGSQLVVDLNSYDYGQGSYYASPTAWNEPPFPPVEGFDTFFYPSLALQQLGISPGLVGDSFGGFGLHFSIDQYFGIAMTSISYLFQAPDWSMGDYGVYVQYDDYHTGFSGGFFRTRTSPYPASATFGLDVDYEVNEPGTLALVILGLAGLGLTRRFRRA